MESVGVRELKDRLSYYLRAVREGESVVVTMWGKPVARLVPISPRGRAAPSPKLREQMWELVAEGFLTWNGGSFQVPEPVAVNQSPQLFSDLVVEDRE